MRKLIVALLVAALCLVAPAIAFEWGNDDLGTEQVFIAHPYFHAGNAYFDVAFGNEDVNTVYPGWCVEPGTDSIRNVWYEATYINTTDVSPEWNMVNWVLNNKGDATRNDIQIAIWRILDMTPSPLVTSWNEDAVQLLVDGAAEQGDFIPECGGIWTVLVSPTGDFSGQDLIIEIDMPQCPPEVPEFPTMMIPVFLVGSLMVVASVLKKE